MKNKTYLWTALLVGSALGMPQAIPAAGRDMMKDDKAMMEKGMKDGKDAMTKDKVKAEKSGKTAIADDKMKMDDKIKMEPKK